MTEEKKRNVRRSRIPNAVQLNITISREVLWGIEKLAKEDDRSTRDYIRVTLKKLVNERIKDGTIEVGAPDYSHFDKGKEGASEEDQEPAIVDV